MARARGFAAGKFALELDGAHAGWLLSASGGDAEGEVVHEPLGADAVVRKHLGSIRYNELELVSGAGMEKAFYDWIAATLGHAHTRKDGAVISADAGLKEVARLSFFDALASEITFPALDAASKDPARLTVRLAPDSTRTVKGSGAKVAGQPAGRTQKTWLSSNFRLSIDKLDCKRVSKIDSVTVKQSVAESSVGDRRRAEMEPSHLEIGDLVVTVAEANAADFVAWHDDFVINGNNGANAEKAGKLELLAPDLKTVLFTLELAGLGIFKLERSASGGEAVSTLRASMYCEELVFTAA